MEAKSIIKENMQNHNGKNVLESNIILVSLIFRKIFTPYINRNRAKMPIMFDIYPRSQLVIEICRSLGIFSPMHLELLAIPLSMYSESSVVKSSSLDSFVF